MKQYALLFCVFTVGVLLTACSDAVPKLVWLTPGEGGAVSGMVALRAQALQEPFPANAVFYVDAEPVAKAYAEDGFYNAVWDSRGTAGDVVLAAKPYGGQAVSRTVTVALRQDDK